jgi:hypothetical protein
MWSVGSGFSQKDLTVSRPNKSISNGGHKLLNFALKNSEIFSVRIELEGWELPQFISNSFNLATSVWMCSYSKIDKNSDVAL